jgi:hypothetical protein
VLFFNTTGSNNIALGFQAGLNRTTGSNNIDIGNKGAAASPTSFASARMKLRRTPILPALVG